MTRPSRRPSTLVIVLAGALVLALFSTGGAVAGGLITSAKIKNNTIKSKDIRNNTLKSIDVRDGALTGADIADGSLTNQDVGVLYASVESDGTLGGSSGGVSASRPQVGVYNVIFPKDVSACAFTATVGTLGEGFDAGQVNVADLESTPTGIFVRTFDPSGANPTNMDFHLTVVC